MGLVLRYKVPEGVALLELEYRRRVNKAGGSPPLDKVMGVGTFSIGGDVDEEAELAALAMGFEPRGVMKKALLWEKSPDDFLTSSKNLKSFAKALRRQGVDALGVSLDEVRHLLSFAAQTIVDGESNVEKHLITCGCTDEFFQILDIYFPEHRRHMLDPKAELDWPRAAIRRFTEAAIFHEDEQALNDAEDLVRREDLLTVGIEIEKCERSYYETYVSCDAEVTLYILGSYYEAWQIEGTGSFDDPTLSTWTIEETAAYGLDSDTENALMHAGVTYEGRALLEDLSELTPEVPIPDGDGDWAVFINGKLHGRWRDLDEAREFFVMSNEVAGRIKAGDTVGLYAKANTPHIDWTDIRNWKEIA